MSSSGKNNSVLRSAIAMALAAGLPAIGGQALAQQAPATPATLQEVVVTGSQIRGAVISEALPVSIVNSETIETFGINSGDQLLALIP